MQINISKQKYIDIIFFIATLCLIVGQCGCGIVLSKTVLFLGAYLVLMVGYVGLTYILYLRDGEYELTFPILFPIILSAFQNVYLALICSRLSTTSFQIMIITNYLFAALFMVLVYFNHIRNKKRISITINLLIVLTLCIVSYGIFLYALHGGALLSIFSSIRNLTALIIFMCVGLLAEEETSESKIYLCFDFIILIVLLIGFYQWFINPNMWVNLNIAELWTKKGIITEAGRLPANHYAAEPYFGRWWPRMTSTVADPVNLGTFLFAGFMTSWYRKKYWLTALSTAGIVFVISKGAVLGILVFLVIYAYYRMPRTIFAGTILVCLVAGVAFLVYAKMMNSTSVFIHLSGFFSAFQVLKEHPLGLGIGNIGTLAMVMGNTQDAGVYESGIGMIIGQLGIVGIGCYALALGLILRKISLLHDVSDRILGVTLFWAILANVMFNEVALSPNSSAMYFIILGLLAGKSIHENGVKNE